MINKYNTIIDNLVHWGESSDKLYAALIVGSQSREDHQADEYSDLDIILIVDEPDYFLSSDQWLNQIEKFYVSFIENTITGEKERRVLFDGALDVDFVILSKDAVNAITAGSEAMEILERGYRILIDKIGLQNLIPQVGIVKQSYTFPSKEEFRNTVCDFWYHSVWTAKKLKRGELWTVKSCLDSYMKWRLLWIIECHAHAIHGLDYDTWHDGRFVEEWAEDWIIEMLSQCFSHYNKEDTKIALMATMDLFRLVATEVAEKLKFKYPKDADDFTTKWVASIL